jgi:hypothetical protein
MAAALVAVERLFESITGTSRSLKGTVQILGLSLGKAFATGKAELLDMLLTFYAMRDVLTGTTTDTTDMVRGLSAARIEAQAFQAVINEIESTSTPAAPFTNLADEIERAKGKLIGLARDIDDSVSGLFPGGESSQTRAKGVAGGASAAGQTAGVEYTSGLASGVQQGAAAINEELLQALTVDPDDGEVITSFKDLWKNIGKVFSSNPIGFLGGLLGSSGVGGGGGIGFAHGGRIGSRGGASLAHMFARGFAGGGRPSGLDPRDTVPIWAQPGEWVIQARAAAKYGSSAMAALNAGLIDSGALAALAGGLNVPQPARHSSSGYALGGAVGAAAGGAGGGPQVLPVMVATRENAEHIAHAGRGAILRLFSEDPDFRGLLSR